MRQKEPPQRSKQTYLTVWVPFLYKDPPVEASKNTTKHAFTKQEDYAGSESHSVSLITFTILVIINGKLSWQGQKVDAVTLSKKFFFLTLVFSLIGRIQEEIFTQVLQNTETQKGLSASSSGHVLC